MRCTHCEKCCHETEMELCEADVVRLERLGFRKDDFSLRRADGVRRLVNRDGYCFFYDRAAKRCSVYPRRPLGCVIYPVNLSEYGDVVVDELCPESGSVSEAERVEKGRRLRSLVDTIASEAARAKH